MNKQPPVVLPVNIDHELRRVVIEDRLHSRAHLVLVLFLVECLHVIG